MDHCVQRVIERRDANGASQRLAQRENLSRLALRRDVAGENLAIVPQRLHRGEPQHVQRAADFVAGLAQAESGFPGDEPGKLFASDFQMPSGLLKNLGALEAREVLALV